MGVLNVTPDSFFAGSRFLNVEDAVHRGIKIFEEGADIIDVGGESTRPSSDPVDETEEIRRVVPVIQTLSQKVPIKISIDTMKPKVAMAAIEAGAGMINDVSGFRDPEMRKAAAMTGVEICVMHMLGNPKSMQQNPVYPEGIIEHLLRYFDAQISLLVKEGVKKNQIIIDPGIGFGKTVADNLEIIHNLRRLKDIGFPLLLGASRKSFMSRLLNKPADDLLAATIATNTLGILAGVDLLRVHDVREHRDVINLMENVKI